MEIVKIEQNVYGTETNFHHAIIHNLPLILSIKNKNWRTAIEPTQIIPYLDESLYWELQRYARCRVYLARHMMTEQFKGHLKSKVLGGVKYQLNPMIQTVFKSIKQSLQICWILGKIGSRVDLTTAVDNVCREQTRSNTFGLDN